MRSPRGAAWQPERGWVAARSLRPTRGSALPVDGQSAVRAGLTLAHSNGQTEGHVNRLKLAKRAMYGRGKLDLLEWRVLCAA